MKNYLLLEYLHMHTASENQTYGSVALKDLTYLTLLINKSFLTCRQKWPNSGYVTEEVADT